MFGFKSKQNDDDVLHYAIFSADDFSLAPQEFYTAVEAALQAIKVPGLEIAREEFAEGGLLSDKRLYLRLMRERLTFYVCAAPFGTRYFFSCRTVYVPPVVKVWHVCLVLLLLAGIYVVLVKYLGLLLSLAALLALLGAACLMFRNVVVLGFNDVDALLLKIPAIGPIYELFFRKDTYYRKDTRNMYLDTIPAVIQKLAEEVTGAKGVKLVRQHLFAPTLFELYQPLSTCKPAPDK